MWKPESRTRHDRAGQRYPSDLSDEEWALIPPAARRAGGMSGSTIRHS